MEPIELSWKTSSFSQEEVRAVADLHRTQIPGGFLASFGLDVLALLYEQIAQSSSSVIIAAYEVERNELVGYICGSLDCRILYREFLWKKGWRALLVFLPALLSFARLRGAVETLFYPSKKEFTGLPTAEIINFAIRREYRGKGISHTFFRKLEEYFKSHGVNSIKIVTGGDQERAQGFYEKIGARLVSDVIVHKGKKSLVFIYYVQ